MTTAIETLAAFCARTTVADLPDAVVETARAKIADAIACALAGTDHDVAQLALGIAGSLPPGEVGTVLTARGVTPLDACFLNAVFIHAILQDDVDLATGHPACTVIGPALAIGCSEDNSGDDLITAVVLGYEAMWRCGGRGAFLMRASARGFRGNTILGALGSAVATAYLMRLNERGIANAIAIAASFAAGLLEPLNSGTMERAYQQGANARQGAMAAYLARAGVQGCLTVFDGDTGFYRAFADLPGIPADAMEDLGRNHRIAEAFAKPYPSAGSNTVGLAVTELLMRRHRIRAQNVARVRVRVLPRFTGVPGYPSIAFKGPFRTVEEALISFPFQLATMLTTTRVDISSLRQSLTDDSVSQLARSVELIGVDVPHPLWCEIDIEQKDGSHLVATSDEIDWGDFYLGLDNARGKLLSVATTHLGPEAAQRLVAAVLPLCGGRPRPRAIADVLHSSPVRLVQKTAGGH